MVALQQKWWTVLCVGCLLTIVGYYLYTKNEMPETIPERRQERINNRSSQLTTRPGPRRKQFLYYAMAKSCLPPYLMDFDVFGNETDCRCSVLVLFYKSKCTIGHPNHVRYVDGRGTTWTGGRNMLYREGKKLEDYEFYIYHTFLDSDIKFLWTPHKFLATPVNIAPTPLRAYEKFLIKVKPAVGATDYFTGLIDFEGCARNRIRAGCFPDKYPEYSLMFHADASLNSFHRNALDNLFPMNEHFENTSWWTSQQAMYVRMNALYPLQNVRYHAVAIFNQAHSDYPARVISYPLVADDERKMAPAYLRNASFWKQICQLLLQKYDCFKISHQQVKRISNLKMVPSKIPLTYNESMFGKSKCR